MEKKEIEKKYVELNLIDQQLKIIQKQLIFIENQILELEGVIQNLDEIKSLGSKKEGLVALTNGIFVKSNIEQTEPLIVNVGANVLVEKSIDETKIFIREQLSKLRAAQQTLTNEFNALALRADELEAELTK